MARSDTEPDVIDATRPKYALGREVSFVHVGRVMVGTVARSKQVVHGRNMLRVTYDIDSGGTTFSNVPEESVAKVVRRR